MATTISKDVKYINKDFGQFRQNLINFAKNYFPNTYNDFNESSPGMMFIEMASYVGDVLSFYTDNQLRESLVSQAQERSNLYTLAGVFGSKVRTNSPATVTLDVFQLVPAAGSGANAKPDFSYALSIQSDMRVSTETGINFRTLESVDFRASGSNNPLDVSVYEIDGSGNVTKYLLKKQIPAISGDVKTTTYSFTTPKIYDKIVLPDTNVLEIISIVDSDNNKWYEVDYLAQDTIIDAVENISYNDPALSADRGNAPYILKLSTVPRRFVTRLNSTNNTEIQFGAGISSNVDEEIIPNPKNVGNGLQYLNRTTSIDIDPSNFLYTQTYGIAPSNTTLTITYTVGGGVANNVGVNSIVNIDSVTYNNSVDSNLNSTLLNAAKNSVAVSNPNPASGGSSQRSIENIRQDAMANFAAQNRAVTREDYIVRCYSMPPKFGAVQKAYIIQDDQTEMNATGINRIANPLALNLYTLGYNDSKQLVTLNDTVKENLKTYLSQYRILTDAINIKDAFIINIGVEFEIITKPNYNSNEVLLRCVDYLKRKFDNDNMQINQPIVISNLYSELDNVDGVQSVVKVLITNLFDSDYGYSGNVYSIAGATKNGIVYPSLDPSVFEIKFPNQDIKGRVVTY
jgi:hypothetical protein